MWDWDRIVTYYLVYFRKHLIFFLHTSISFDLHIGSKQYSALKKCTEYTESAQEMPVRMRIMTLAMMIKTMSACTVETLLKTTVVRGLSWSLSTFSSKRLPDLVLNQFKSIDLSVDMGPYSLICVAPNCLKVLNLIPRLSCSHPGE